MANRDLTEMRVRNAMKQIPKSAVAKRQNKVRNTIRSTMSSMKTVLGQLRQGNMDKLRNEKRRRKIIAVVVLAVVAIIVVLAAKAIF